jgi:hypothetical protein
MFRLLQKLLQNTTVSFCTDLSAVDIFWRPREQKNAQREEKMKKLLAPVIAGDISGA